MSRSLIFTTVRRAFTAITFATIVMATPSAAHATSWSSWWHNAKPSWWSFRPRAVSTPEIDAGLVRSAAAIVAGGLVVLRSRKKRQS